MVHIPYKGTAPALTGLMSGDIQILVDVPSTLMPHVRGGKIKAIAMFSGKRVPGAAEVPTLPESGGPAIESSTWLMFLAPAGTPQAIVNRLSQEADKAINAPEMRARFDQLGIFAGGGTPDQAGKFLREEIARWAKVINTAGVKAEH
jgi:tripartite-type tricarboxylate transporter receptor subunit TctC